MKKVVLYTVIASFILIIFTGVVLETFDFDFITETLMLRSSIFLFGFCLAIYLFIVFFTSKKKLSKIFTFIFACFLSMFSFFAIEEVIYVFQDKVAYENKDFNTIEGIPEDAFFKTNDSAQNTLINFEIDGVSLDTIHITITEKEYQEQYKNQEIKVEYLPNSKMVMDITTLES